MKHFWAAALIPLVLCGIEASAEESTTAERHQFTYAWPFRDDDAMKPRGGTTEGPAVRLDTQPGQAWLELQEDGISKKERDRRAILAMAGGFRASFDFIETVGFVDGFEPDRPYQSWGTEYVYVVADEPDFISLQHIIVMFFVTEDGETMGPAVVKHWRQDWRYEDADLHVFVGHDTWQRRTIPQDVIAGTWSQSVFQVDDSPRYQAIGHWQHHGNHSSWLSESTWRPLPRREFSIRDDYHALSGTNRHTITPTGWVHEEDNLKLVLDDDGTPRADTPYLSREAGFNRYERIVDHDFSAGDSYWAATGPFWADVRAAWDETFVERDRVSLSARIDDQRLFEVMFEYAGRLNDGQDYDPTDGRTFIRDTLDRFLK